MPSTTVRTAQRLIKVLGPVARTHAMQTALDMRAAGDREQERLWLDVADVIHEHTRVEPIIGGTKQ